MSSLGSGSKSSTAKNIGAHKAEPNPQLLVDRIEVIWKPGEWLAYYSGGKILIAKYAGVSAGARINVWLADGAIRAIDPEVVALDWCPDAVEILEERLSIMLSAGVPEEDARPRAERCTREYFERFGGGTVIGPWDRV